MARAARGFTLVEVLVATTVLSLIVVATITALRTFADTQARIERVTTRLDELRITSDFIGRGLRQAVVVVPAMEFSQYFIGQATEVSWVAPMLAAGNASGLHYIRLYRAGETLMLQLVPYRPESPAPDWESATPHRLLDGVSEMQLEYRGAAGEPWAREWTLDEPGIPQAARLRLRVSERFWPDIVVAIDQYGRRM